ncbi:hypothetical protein [Lentiprolixibacter aurantiacus]|uniref:Uncharacterized protein n=1 Tax=Lentiprolixibacter aurantiacus TaxID=2993939 RepID=A0AAE3MKY1_9FLAO|nr:hypothetical protein [Lentiprolixibacter aurantiacus]MCX2718809.1 hypothetical protein [Lentiprolixibacter aurantiacus]
MNIINIIKGIELLAVELLLWIIYVPKTIYKIIKDPKWAPGYIKEQLRSEEKFKTYMSPILLFLAISVVLFVLLDSGLIIAPDYDESGGSFGQRLQGPAGFLFLALPLFFGLVIELFRKGGIKRDNILQSLYVQCYYFSPLMLSFFAYLLADQFDWGNLSEETYLSMFPLFLFLLTLLWFIIIQVNYISRELQYHRMVSLGLHLICYVLIGIGFGIYLVLTPTEVDEHGKGMEVEKVVLTLPEKGDYKVAVWDSIYDPAWDYAIARLEGRSEYFQPSEKLRLVHNQFVVGNIQETLKFSFSGNKGDQVMLKGSQSLLSPPDSLTSMTPVLNFDASVQKNESLMFTYSEESGYVSTGIWELELLDDNAGFILSINLPKTGDYTLVIYNTQPNNEAGFTLGFFKYDIYGQYKETNSGILMDSTMYLGISMAKEEPFENWIFPGTKNKELTLFATPTSEVDLAFNVVNEKGESIVPVDRTAVANIIHALYIILFGSLIAMGYRGLFRKSERAQEFSDDAGNRAGKIVAVIGLLIIVLILLAFIFL